MTRPDIERIEAEQVLRRKFPKAQWGSEIVGDIDALLTAIDELTRDLNDAVDAHIKITAAMRCGGRTPEKALDTMLRIRQKLGRDK